MRYYGADNRAVIYIRGCAAVRIFIVVPEPCVRSRLSGRVPSGIPRERHRDHPDVLLLIVGGVMLLSPRRNRGRASLGFNW